MSLEWTIGGNTVDFAVTEENPTIQRGQEITIQVGIDDPTVYNTLKDYLRVPGSENAVRRGTTDRGEPWFRERVSQKAPINSYLVEVTTGSDVQDVEDFWALLVNGNDVTEPPSAFHELELQFWVIAGTNTYATETDVRDEFEDER